MLGDVVSSSAPPRRRVFDFSSAEGALLDYMRTVLLYLSLDGLQDTDVDS